MILFFNNDNIIDHQLALQTLIIMGFNTKFIDFFCQILTVAQHQQHYCSGLSKVNKLCLHWNFKVRAAGWKII